VIRRVALVAIVPLAAATAACLDALGPDVGPLDQVECDESDSNPGLDVHYQADLIDGVFADPDIDCADCHTGNGDGVQISGFDISTYQTFRLGGGRSGPDIVIPGNPCASILVQKLEGSPPFGARMPRNGPPFLTSDDVQLVKDWIIEGARDN
jgi:hypothetical protein